MLVSMLILSSIVMAWSEELETRSDQSLRIGAFNVQIFGQSKFKKENVVAVLSKIVQRYDVVLIQEIRDSSETVIYSFLSIVNSECPSGVSYKMTVSERLGRTTSKEQYAYMYRVDKVEEPLVYQYEDVEDVFEREPYCVLIKPKQIGLPSFFLVGIHTKPTEAPEEINFLDDVFEQASLKFGTDNGIILGDFNADCSYLSNTKYQSLDLVTDSKYSWLIDTHTDTTISASECAYDRVVVSGDIVDYIPRASARVFRFDTEYGLSTEESKEISDHYPVEFQVGGVYTDEQGTSASSKGCDLEAIGPGLKVAAFNVQVFGTTKFGKEHVVKVLSQIVRQYDVILIQEIRDSSQKVVYFFLDIVNSECPSGVSYKMTVSERLGRTRSKEQYAFMYRLDKVDLLAIHQYEDTDDVFEREPYSVLLRSKEIDIPEFFLVGIHTKPTEALEEINFLDDVFERVSLKFGTENGIILGDFNADCSYLSNTKYQSLDLVTDSKYSWLIDTHTDTTISASSCAYDRIVVSGDLVEYIPRASARVFRFDTEYGLSTEESKDVSDHYPVEFQLFSKKQLNLCSNQSQQQSTKDEL